MLRSNRNNRNNENRRNDNSPSRSLKFEKLENRLLMAQLTFGTPIGLRSGVNTVDFESGPTNLKNLNDYKARLEQMIGVMRGRLF